MHPQNRPNFNTESGLTPNGGGRAGDRPGSAPKGNETGPPGASRAGVRRFFAPGTAASAATAPGGSGGLPADIGLDVDLPPDAPPATLGRLCIGLDVGAGRGGSGPGGGLRLDDVGRRGRGDLDGHVVVGAARAPEGRGDLVDVARANPFTPPPPGPEATRR